MNAKAAAPAPDQLSAVIGDRATGSLVRRLRDPANGLPTQDAGPLDPEIAAAIEERRGRGAPLSDGVRSEMEGFFGTDLGALRVHTDDAAATLNRAVNAEAFTSGSDVFFSAGTYDTTSDRGRRLLAHELTHVVQQATEPRTSARVSGPADADEREASRVADQYPAHAPAHTVQHAAVEASNPVSAAFQTVRRQAHPTNATPTSSASSHEGGLANAEQVKINNRAILGQWKDGAKQGIDLFATAALEQRIIELSAGSWQSFVLNLLGNTLWAATVFLAPEVAVAAVELEEVATAARTAEGVVSTVSTVATVERVASPATLKTFGVSMAGIGIAAVPSIPSRRDRNVIAAVQNQCYSYINHVYEVLHGKVEGAVEALLAFRPTISMYRASAVFIRESFLKDFYHLDGNYATLPLLPNDPIKDAYWRFAEERLHIVTTVGRSITTLAPKLSTITTTMELAWIRGPSGKRRLAILDARTMGIFGHSMPEAPSFEEWVPDEHQAAALAQWAATGHGQPAVYDARDVGDLHG